MAKQSDSNDIFHPLRVEKGSTDALRGHLEGLAEFLQRLNERLQSTIDPDQMTVMLANLATRSAVETSRIAVWLGRPTDQIAWATRNLFELNLRARYLLADAKNVERSRAEMVSDQMKLLEALMKLFGDSDAEHRAAIQRQIELRRDQLHKHHLPLVKPMMAADLAAQVGATDEYERFYGLYSKYVHPSAYLLSSGQEFFEVFDRHSRNTLLLNAQQYARDTLQLIAVRTGVDLESLREG